MMVRLPKVGLPCRFMEADLKAVNRTKTPWVILNGHRPIYTCDTQPNTQPKSLCSGYPCPEHGTALAMTPLDDSLRVCKIVACTCGANQISAFSNNQHTGSVIFCGVLLQDVHSRCLCVRRAAGRR